MLSETRGITRADVAGRNRKVRLLRGVPQKGRDLRGVLQIAVYDQNEFPCGREHACLNRAGEASGPFRAFPVDHPHRQSRLSGRPSDSLGSVVRAVVDE